MLDSLVLPDLVEEEEVDDLDPDDADEGSEDAEDTTETGDVSRSVLVLEQQGTWSRQWVELCESLELGGSPIMLPMATPAL